LRKWPVDSITPQMIKDTRERIKHSVVRTPLVRLNVDDAPASIFLKLENLQPTSSFKVRGVCNALALSERDALSKGVYTVSAGNMAQALAWRAKQIGVPCSVIVPENAPATKLQGIKRYGARIIPLGFEEVWEVVKNHRYDPLEREGWNFIHPFADARMIAGNGTIGFELLEDLSNLDSIVVPFGGGGLSAGIAVAIKSQNPRIRVYACEPETAAPLAASYSKGSAQEVNRIPTFVDGIGGKSVVPEMWTLVHPLLEGSIVVSLRETADALRLILERNRVLAEGAGAASVAAALTGKAGSGNVACIVSGGNIDPEKLVTIVHGDVPSM
jgi:threonine dehydratase